MKKPLNQWRSDIPLLKFDLKMKLTTLLLITTIFGLYANDSYAQRTKVTLDVENTTVREVIDEIESSTDFRFIYKIKNVNLEQKVSLKVKNVQIEIVLQSLFQNTNTTYKVRKTQIILSQKLDSSKGIPKQTRIDISPNQNIVTGQVTDGNQAPLPGVNVLVKSTTTGTLTDFDGNYSINASQGDILVFSYVGMKTENITVGASDRLDVRLNEDASKLEEVVVVGYGTQRRHNVTGAISRITEEDISGRQVRSLDQMMQGKMAGVNIKTNSGKPGGEGADIIIRGVNSFGTSSYPLVLIDGIEGEINSVAPENVQSVSVMKDAASAAIYGSRAANGVVLITTKRGRAGELNITYNANFSTQYYTRMPETVMDPVEYMQMWNRAATFSNDPFQYNQEYIDGMKSGKYKGYDYTDNIFQHAFVQSHNLNLNGGTEKIKFNMGINYWSQPGVVKLYSYDRINILMNLDAKINEWITAGGQVNITRGVSKEPSLGDEEIFLGYFNQKPTTPPQFPDGRWVSTQFPEEYFTWGAAEKLARGQSVKQQYFGDVQAYLKITPIDGLIWETKVATSYKHSFDKNFNTGNHAVYVYTTEELTEPQNPNSRSVNVDSPTSLYNTLYSTATYENIFHKHHVKALAGYSVESYNIDKLRAGRSNYPTDNLGEINAGDSSTKSNSGSSEAYALQSVFGRFDYNYDDKYLFQANLRSDWSSRFPKGNRLGVFPSFSAGWRISNENFFKNTSWLSGLKLRASWGQLGNQNIGFYPYQETYSLGKNYPFDGLEVGALQDGLKDQNITWETTTVTDAGFDMNIKNGLFTMSFDYYYKLTDDILRSQQVTALVGMNGPTINNGSVSNKGFEVLVGHSKQLNKLKYWLNANFSYNKNTLEKFGSTEIGSTTIKEEGQEWNTWYMYEFDGVYQNDAEAQALPIDGNIVKPGTAKFKDLNGDGQITNIDRTYVGNRIPKFNYGFNFGAKWGFFDFSAFIQGVQGVKTYQNLFGIAPFVQMSRPSTFWRDSWTTENQSNTIPALYVGRTGNVLDNYPNTFYLFNASYVRLKNIQVGYNIPSHILEPFKMSSARIALSGENLITATKYPGQDPERNLGDALYSTYPQNKSYSIEITVKF